MKTRNDPQSADAERGNAGRLQAAMESGRTPGRRSAQDPGAVPLGTDDEAAGTPPSAAAIDHEVHRADSGRGHTDGATQNQPTGKPALPEESPRRFGRLVTFAAVIILAIIAWFVLV